VIRQIWAGSISPLHRDRYSHLYPGMDHHS
jgi:hypothetical protein